jgi:hypothetical protein
MTNATARTMADRLHKAGVEWGVTFFIVKNNDLQERKSSSEDTANSNTIS